MNNTNNYLLAGGAAELERLRLQARVWEPEAEAMLDQAMEDCGGIADDPETVMMSFIVTQVWGRKPE